MDSSGFSSSSPSGLRTAFLVRRTHGGSRCYALPLSPESTTAARVTVRDAESATAARVTISQ